MIHLKWVNIFWNNLLDTTPTLRGGLNQCVDTSTNFSNFSQQLLITSSYVAYTTFINLQSIITVDEPCRQCTPDVNGKLNHIFTDKKHSYNKLSWCGRLQSSQIFSTPTDSKSTNSLYKTQLVSLGSNQEGFEESNPQG